MAKSSVKSVCPYCGVGCGIVLHVDDGRVVKVAGDKSHPSNFGRLCTKGSTCNQAIAQPGRLDKAQMRHPASKDHVSVPLDRAIAETARRLNAIKEAHGPDAIAFYVSGQMSLEAQYLSNKLAKGFIQTRHMESNSRLCMASAGFGYKMSLGADAPPGSYQDLDHADLFFVIGANMADCHPILFLRMMDRVKAGAKLIVVDPRRTATADKADLFLQIRPGTDLALMNGLLHLLIENGRTDSAFIAEFTEGWETIPPLVADYPPAVVAEITGLPEADLRKAAELIGNAPEWMSLWTMGLNQSTHGTWNTNTLCNLHLATGKICRLGSGPFSLTGQPNAMGGRDVGYMGAGLPGQRSLFDAADRTFVEGLWGLPQGNLRATVGDGAVSMFKALKAGTVKAVWIICTNPVATLPNRQNVIDGLKAADLVITQDAFLDTETNMYADIMLPGALWAEAEGVMVNSERNMTLMPKAVEPPGDAVADWEIIARVAQAMGYGDAFAYSSASEIFDEFKRAWNPKTGWDIRGASHRRLAETPLQWPIAAADSADRNPIRYTNDGISQPVRIREDGSRPALTFPTPSGKAAFLARPHMAAAELPDPTFPLVLSSGRLQHQWHTLTKTGKIPTLNKLNPAPFLEIHPADAQDRGITAKDRIEVRSRRGRIFLPAVVTDRVRQGTCFAPFHWNDVYGEDIAVNALTNDAVDPLSFQPEFKHCAIELERTVNHEVRASDHQLEVATTVAEFSSSPAGAAQPSPAVLAFSRLVGIETAVPPTFDSDERLYLQGFLAGLAAEPKRSGAVPTVPTTSPFNIEKRLYLDGMLAGLFSRGATDDRHDDASPGPQKNAPIDDRKSVKRGVTVLWASQTGNAEAFAQSVATQLERETDKVRLCAMDQYDISRLPSEHFLLVVTSTFGDGDPPDNGVEFWKTLNGAVVPALTNLNYAVLAFGDSSYDQFCGFGRKLDARLDTLGARRLIDRLDCEPDHEDERAEWRTRVGEALATAFAEAGLDRNTAQSLAAPDVAQSPGTVFSRKNPFASRLVGNRILNAPGSAKEIRHFAFDLGSGGPAYEPGDALGIWPTNCPDHVAEMIEAMNFSASDGVTLDGVAMTLTDALTTKLDIARVTPDLLKWWAARSNDEALRALLAADRNTQNEWLADHHVIDLIKASPISVSPSELIGTLKKLQPRLYSISSSPRRHENQVHLTVSVVRYDLAGRARKGVSSTYLADRAQDGAVPIFIQKSANFRLPKDPSVPIIMVGPGTGVAPFIAFLQEREAIGAKGRNWLFFGEQTSASDFYYREELEGWQSSGHLARLDTAFSRDQPEKIYVQHRMLSEGAALWNWLQDGAYFYVCGDASRMARDVDATLKQVIATFGDLDESEADRYVARMAAEKRYVRDVY
ncbi:sulfite reductase subunit alpha [Beijerinckia sp. L45]|uniref:sulfite reductase subunit alpha n=1 Tax=Beijerinckia sp. L45 TaxID=1641855 RepID=UPI00131C7D90|nr:sulfite reductase subunit alpha [Beijerinckia sp. L45]